jgi:hypothetical protein
MVLERVGNKLTRRSVVYDVPNRRILWKTEANPSIRWLDLASLSFTPGSPTKTVNVEVDGFRNVGDRLVAYSEDANREIVRNVFGSKVSDETRELLRERGLTYEQALELIALHPTRGITSHSSE